MNKVNRRFHAALHVLTVSVLVSSVAYAHHGTAGRYEDQLSEISGTVIQLMFINPHALLAVEVEDEAGNPVRWMAEFNNPPLMATEGWHKNILKPGDRVTIRGLKMKNGGPSIRLSRGANGAQVILTATDEVIFTEEPPNR